MFTTRYIILDSERSEEASDFTMVFIFFYRVYKISTRRSAAISTYSTLYSTKLDQDPLEIVIFRFLSIDI